MAEEAVRESLDEIVKAIGFGIVGDFRQLYDAMRDVSSDLRTGNAILDQVNQNTKDVSKTLDDFQAKRVRDREARAYRSQEDKLEGRTRLNAQRSEEALQRIQKTLDAILRDVKLGGGDGGSIVDDVAAGAAGAAAGGAAGSFLKGALKVGKVGAVLAGAAAVGAAGAYLMSGSSTGGEEGASVGPASGPAASTSVPTPASDLARMGGATAAVGASAGAAALISRSTMSAKQKALAKIGPKVPTYLSKFGGRIATTIGLKSIPIFGALVGGYFSFSRFMSGDSWQAIGFEFASGIAPDVGALGGPAGYVAGVASTLAIQTYLICRDIYQEENAVDIKNNVVPNFDDLDWSERALVLNSVKGYVESYVNTLLGRSKTADSTTGITPTSTSGAAMGGAGGMAAMAGAAGATMAGATATASEGGGQSQTPPATGGDTGGITTGAAQDIAAQREVTPPGQVPDTEARQGAYTQNLYSSPQTTGGTSASPQIRTDTGFTGGQNQSASPSDTIATVSTGSDLAADIGSSPSFEAQAAAYMPRLMQDYGLTAEQAAGIIGNLGHESAGMQAGIQERGVKKGRGGLGWAQWTGPRRRAFEKYLQDTGQRASDPEANYGFLKYELDTEYQSSINRLRQTDNIRDATISFEKTYERAGVKSYDSRIGYAQRALGLVSNGQQSESPVLPEGTDQFAEGAKVTPLSVDQPKSGSRPDVLEALRPPKDPMQIQDEDTLTSSQRTIDARKKGSFAGSPQEKTKNMLSTYMPYMEHIFNGIDLRHAREEVTADIHFEEAMNPLY